MNSSLKIMALMSWAFVISTANAADIRPAKSAHGQPLSAIMIEGEIKPGDYIKFINVFLENDHRNYKVILKSPGGDFLEALKIGRLIHALKLTTSAPEKTQVKMYEIHDSANNVCASSCFFIFVAGAQRFGEIVGIHRPYLPKDAYRKLNMDEASQTHLKVRHMVEDYLEDVDVPLSYVERIMAVDSEDIEWLSEDELKKNFYGYAPAYREWMDAKCPPVSESDTKKELQILDATPSIYENTPVGKIPYEPSDKAFLDKMSAQRESYYGCRESIQRKEVDRIWRAMLMRMAKREREKQEAKSPK